MKSRSDFDGFTPDTDYREYLLNYYTGLYVAGMLANPTSVNPLLDATIPVPVQMVSAAIKLAEETIKQLGYGE